MKRIIVKDLDGKITNVSDLEDEAAIAWQSKCQNENLWGLPGTYTVEIIDTTEEAELAEVLTKRRAAYPPLEELADAIVDRENGNDETMATYVSKCLAVKASFPKPALKAIKNEGIK